MLVNCSNHFRHHLSIIPNRNIPNFTKTALFQPHWTTSFNQNRAICTSIYQIYNRITKKKDDTLQEVLRNAIISDSSFRKKSVAPLIIAHAAILLGAPINRQDRLAKDGHNDYHLVRCAYYKCNAIAKLLLRKGANPNVTCMHGHSPVITASERHNYELVEALIKAGANVNHQDNDGITALMEACQSLDDKMMNLLIDAGANVQTVDNEGNNALLHALKRDCYTLRKSFANDFDSFLHCMRNFIQLSNINFADNEGNTPLMIAVEKGYLELIKLLLEAKADKQLTNNLGQTALSIALTQKKRKEEQAQRLLEIMKILQEEEKKQIVECQHDNINKTNNTVIKTAFTRLTSAIFKNDLEEVKLCIQEGDDVNEMSLREPPLTKAALKGHVEIVRELIKAKANVLTKNYQGNTPYQTTLWWYQHNQKDIEGYDEALSLLTQVH